jgi:hypothetical protein
MQLKRRGPNEQDALLERVTSSLHSKPIDPTGAPG